MLDSVLIIARFGHFAATLLVFGAAVFPYYAGITARFAMRSAALVALLSGLVWFDCILVNVTGDAAAVFAPDQIWLVLFSTGFGKTWAIHLALCIALTVASFARSSVATTLFATAGLLSLAGIGHAAMGEGVGQLLHFTVNAAHLLAAGIWLGGLIPLWLALRTLPPEARSAVVERFKWAGYAAVSLVLVTGAANTWLVSGALLPAATTTYGQLLLVKITLVAALLGVALFNQFFATRRHDWRLLARGIAAEVGFFAAIILAVSWLGMTSPMDM